MAARGRAGAGQANSASSSDSGSSDDDGEVPAQRGKGNAGKGNAGKGNAGKGNIEGSASSAAAATMARGQNLGFAAHLQAQLGSWNSNGHTLTPALNSRIRDIACGPHQGQGHQGGPCPGPQWL